MFSSDVMCINSLVDGLTKYKIYTAIDVKLKSDGVFLGIIDDYGVMNYFKEDRFITITDKLLKSVSEYIEKIKGN
jgi:hypothetical protein|nr:hypothetical protein [uncultured Romboutsia sp.]